MSAYPAALFLAAAAYVWIAIYAWRRRPAPGATALILLVLPGIAWSLGYGLELAALSPASMRLSVKIQYLGIATLPAIWVVFAMQFAQRARELTLPKLAIWFAIPAITLALNWTDEFHHLYYQSVSLDYSGPLPLLRLVPGPWYWVHVAYSYSAAAMGIWILVRAFLATPHRYRAQVGIVLLSSLAPWVTNILYHAGIRPSGYLDLTPFAFTLAALTIGWDLVRYRMLDIVPVARDRVVESMGDGVLVVDAQGRVMDMNAAAEEMVGYAPSEVVGEPIECFLAGQPEMEAMSSTAATRVQVVRGEPREARYYELSVTPLHGPRDELLGRLLVWHDVTQRRRAEEELRRAKEAAEAAARVKSAFLASVSHELRTPLNAILGFAQLMSLERDLGREQRASLTAIKVNADRLSEMINDMLAVARIESGTMAGAGVSATGDDAFGSAAASTDALAARLGALPAEWQASLHQAAVEGDILGVQAIVECISASDPELGKQLAAWAADYDFDRVLLLARELRAEQEVDRESPVR